jgi:hypothetical protein
MTRSGWPPDGEDPRIERTTDGPEVFERGDGEGAAGDAEEADGLALELVEPAVVERVLQDAGVRTVIHRRPEQHGVSLADPTGERRAVALCVHVGVQGW